MPESPYWQQDYTIADDENTYSGEPTFLDDFNVDEETDIGDHSPDAGTYDPDSSGTINPDGTVNSATLILNYTNTNGFFHQYNFRLEGDHSVEDGDVFNTFPDEYTIELGEDTDSDRYKIYLEVVKGGSTNLTVNSYEIWHGPSASETLVADNETTTNNIFQSLVLSADDPDSAYPVDITIQIVKNKRISVTFGGTATIFWDTSSAKIHNKATVTYGPGNISRITGHLAQDNVGPSHFGFYYNGSSQPTPPGSEIEARGVVDDSLPDDGTSMDCRLSVYPEDITHGDIENDVATGDISYDSTKKNYLVVGNVTFRSATNHWDTSEAGYRDARGAWGIYHNPPNAGNLWGGPFARMKNSGNYDRYMLKLTNDGTLEIVKAYLDTGTLTFDSLAEKSGFIFLYEEPIELALEVKGNLLNGYLNGNLELSVHNSELTDAGLMGMMANGEEQTHWNIAEDRADSYIKMQLVDWQAFDDDFTTTGTGDLNITAREFVGLQETPGFPSKTVNTGEEINIYEFLPLVEKIRKLLEQVGITDVVSLNITIPLTETITINELLRRWDELITLTEEVSINEAIADLIKQFKLGEAVSVNDAVTLSLLLAIAEQIDITDIIPKSTRKMTDSISIAEVLSAIIQANPNEDVSVGEGVKVIKTNPGDGFEEGEYFKISKQRYFEL